MRDFRAFDSNKKAITKISDGFEIVKPRKTVIDEKTNREIEKFKLLIGIKKSYNENFGGVHWLRP